MTHQAAVDLDLDLVVLAGSTDDPAVIGGAPYLLGSWSTQADLQALADGTQVVTFDHELVPGLLLGRLEELGYRLRPPPGALSLAQDKLKARTVLSRLGFPVPSFARVSSVGDVADFAEVHGWPVVVKDVTGGYDGRGVHHLESLAQVATLFERGSSEVGLRLAEEHVDIASELAVLIARNDSGEVAVYPPVGTVQEGGICRYLLMPAPLPASVLDQARQMAQSIAESIDATGMLAVEMFLDAQGQLLVNELALRPHNSGHVTIEACETSQFHQHLRAVLDWPLGVTTLRRPAATVNLIATSDVCEPSARLPRALSIPGASVHLYGKAPRKGRKLGHVTALAASPEEALATAQAAAALIMEP